jgi:hypothetical protein
MSDPERTLAQVPEADRARAAGALAEVERMARNLRHEVNVTPALLHPPTLAEVAARLAELRVQADRAGSFLREVTDASGAVLVRGHAVGRAP